MPAARARDRLTIRPGSIGSALMELAGGDVTRYRELAIGLLRDGATILNRTETTSLLEAVMVMGIAGTPAQQLSPESRQTLQMDITASDLDDAFKDW